MQCLALSPEIDQNSVIEDLLRTDQGGAVITEQWRINAISESTRRLIDRTYFSVGYLIYPSI